MILKKTIQDKANNKNSVGKEISVFSIKKPNSLRLSESVAHKIININNLSNLKEKKVTKEIIIGIEINHHFPSCNWLNKKKPNKIVKKNTIEFWINLFVIFLNIIQFNTTQNNYRSNQNWKRGKKNN